MEWYCTVFNSDKVNSAIGAQVLYERLCEGDTSLVGDIDIIDEFYEDLLNSTSNIQSNKCKGYVIISCEFKDADNINELVKKLAKKHGLSYYEPQNMEYQF